jgi:CheY-like chemotaxis protein
LLTSLEELFRLEGYSVRTATDSLEAAHLLLAGEDPDLLLLDMHLEGMDGWDLAAEIRVMERNIPICVMTADANPQRCAQEVGAIAYLPKPFDLVALLVMVEHLVRMHR